MITEHLYKNTGNPIVVRLLDDRNGSMQPTDFSKVTRMTLEVGDVLVDSDEDPLYLDWRRGDGMLVIDIASLDIPKGNYVCALRVFDSDYPEGLRWVKQGQDLLYLKVHS